MNLKQLSRQEMKSISGGMGIGLFPSCMVTEGGASCTSSSNNCQKYFCDIDEDRVIVGVCCDNIPYLQSASTICAGTLNCG